MPAALSYWPDTLVSSWSLPRPTVKLESTKSGRSVTILSLSSPRQVDENRSSRQEIAAALDGRGRDRPVSGVMQDTQRSGLSGISRFSGKDHHLTANLPLVFLDEGGASRGHGACYRPRRFNLSAPQQIGWLSRRGSPSCGDASRNNHSGKPRGRRYVIAERVKSRRQEIRSPS